MRLNYLMKGGLLTAVATLTTMMSAWTSEAVAQTGSKVTYTFDVSRAMDEPNVPTECKLNTSLILRQFGLANENDLTNALSAGTAKFFGVQKSGAYYSSSTAEGNARGHWFTKAGVITQSTRNTAAVKSVFTPECFRITHKEGRVEAGQEVNIKQALVYNSKDTVEYVFNIIFGESEKVTSDQPEGFFGGRKSAKDSWVVNPLVKRNDGEFAQQNYIQVMSGDKITLSATPRDESDKINYRWLTLNNKSLRGFNSKAEFVLTETASPEHNGAYVLQMIVTKVDGSKKTHNMHFFVDVQTAAPGTHYDWSLHTPQFGYDFHTEYPALEPPTKTHKFTKKNGQPANCVEGEWWSVFWGDNLNSEVAGNTKNAFTNMMKKYDEDFAYIRDHMGWPPDLSARKGYRSFVYVFGSGLSNDNSPNTEEGGYQSATYADGQNWPCVWASYYPVSRFRDDADSKWNDGEYQREAMIHEGIHALFADMEGVKQSSWFHEAGNTWLQSAMNTERSGTYGTPGFLDACPFIAPFMPIECYSGWLQDGSFGGPAAEGVNMFTSEGKQICTWRNLLGGTQYGNSFPIVLAEICGKGSIPWIWRYCKTRVLEGIGDSIGEEPMRSLILQYRARQATFDIGGWAEGYRRVMDNNFKGKVAPEWEPYWIKCPDYYLTPYAGLYKNDNEGWLAPDTLTNPGWSGANIIPIHVTRDTCETECEVEFCPEDLQMRAQLCYKTKAGKVYYSQPVHCGTMTLDITDKPANGVIFCVVVNTDYVYTGDAQRKKHFDYRIRLGKNAIAPADPYQKWYFHEQNIKDNNFETGIDDVRNDGMNVVEEKGVQLVSGMLRAGDRLSLNLNGVNANDVTVRIVGLSGVVVASGKLDSDGSFALPSQLHRGLYVITFAHNGKRDVFKVIVK